MSVVTPRNPEVLVQTRWLSTEVILPTDFVLLPPR